MSFFSSKNLILFLRWCSGGIFVVAGVVELCGFSGYVSPMEIFGPGISRSVVTLSALIEIMSTIPILLGRLTGLFFILVTALVVYKGMALGYSFYRELGGTPGWVLWLQAMVMIQGVVYLGISLFQAQQRRKQIEEGF